MPETWGKTEIKLEGKVLIPDDHQLASIMPWLSLVSSHDSQINRAGIWPISRHRIQLSAFPGACTIALGGTRLRFRRLLPCPGIPLMNVFSVLMILRHALMMTFIAFATLSFMGKS